MSHEEVLLFWGVALYANAFVKFHETTLRARGNGIADLRGPKKSYWRTDGRSNLLSKKGRAGEAKEPREQNTSGRKPETSSITQEQRDHWKIWNNNVPKIEE